MIEFVLFSIPTLVYLLVRRRDADARPVMGLRWPSASGWLWGVAVLGVSLLIGWLGTMSVPPEILHGPGTTGRIATLVGGLTVALRALGEEVLFRGFIQGLVAKRWGAPAGVLVQAVVFLLPHLLLLTVSPTFVPLVIGQFVIGLLLGWVRHRTGSIAPGALAHIVTNLASGLVG